MSLPNNEVAELVLSSFRIAFGEKDKGQLHGNNPFRSSYFVSLIGDQLKKHFKGAQVNYQSVNSIEEKSKSRGEWLFDISVTSQKEIRDNRHKDGKAMINTNILFACESEFETSLSAFTTDFGKLICSNANQYLFIQGLNQSTEKGREDFIISRKEIIKTQLEHLIRDDFVLAFIPTPGKIKEKSYWDNSEDVINWASVWIYNAAKNDFNKYQEE